MAVFCAKWELVDTDAEFDKYMEATGVSEENRKRAQATLKTKLFQEISRDGNTWKVKVITVAGEKTTDYPEGQNVEVTTLDGRKVQVVYSLEGNQLVELQTGTGFTSKNIRRVSGDTMTMTFHVGGVVATRTYKNVS